MSDNLPSRAEHLAWCKRRALAYLPGDPDQALTSMMSDLSKHPETETHAGMQMALMAMMSGLLRDPGEMRRFIEGFN